jgi:uncharacterized membrane protein SpoIIM required for sporulation
MSEHGWDVSREDQWNELEELCAHLENRRAQRIGAAGITRFGQLYRAACADLALADAYRLPPATVLYLHQLVARAHNQLYRSRRFAPSAWLTTLLEDVPRRIFSDPCVQIAFCLFWGVFIGAAALATDERSWPGFAKTMISENYIDRLEDSFAEPMGGRNASMNPLMASLYIQHNMSIGLQCFLGGLLVIPGLLITLFNAAHLGACFGYMARPEVEAGANFFEFVAAHGPFELTAIVLSAAAGLRLGISWIDARGLSRADSLRKAAYDVMPLMGAALAMFFFAAIIEAFLSPSSAPYSVKALVALASSGLLTAYFVLLGYPREPRNAA